MSAVLATLAVANSTTFALTVSRLAADASCPFSGIQLTREEI
jgi:hypothetical protein